MKLGEINLINSEELEKIRERFISLPSKNEETVKLQVIVPFMRLLGYKEDWFIGENNVLSKRNRVDIAITINERDNKKLYIETKRADKELKDSDIEQLLNYLNIINVEWGILTNGRNYILLNNKISGRFNQKAVFNYNLIDMSNDYILNYLNSDALFKSEVTNYFKHFTQYKALKSGVDDSDSSWKQYKSTIMNFFIYLADRGYYYGLENIRPNDFKDFLIESINKSKSQKKPHVRSKKTIINKYRYLIGMYETFKLNGIVINNPFDLLNQEDMICGIECTDEEKVVVPLSNDEVEKILLAFDKDKSPERNKLIFLMILYCGLDKSEIQQLKKSDIYFREKEITIGDRIIPLCKQLLIKIEEYLHIRKIKGHDSDYLFCKKYRNAYGPLGDSTFNKIINNALENTDIPNERKKQITLASIKESTLIKMLEYDFTAEEISYITGLSLISLEKYLSNVDISKKIKLKKLTTKHPYSNYF